MNTFKVGDRIELLQQHAHAQSGMSGIIMVVRSGYNESLGVAFDAEFTGGHNLYGEIDTPRGHWVPEIKVRLIDTNNKDVSVIDLREGVEETNKIFKSHGLAQRWIKKVCIEEHIDPSNFIIKEKGKLFQLNPKLEWEPL